MEDGRMKKFLPNMRHLLRILLVLAFSIFVIYCAYFAYMNHKGYCFAQEKYLTDDEKIRVAIAHEIRRYPRTERYTDSGLLVEYLPPQNLIPYRDVDEFLTINPNCCQLRKKRNSEQPVLLFREWTTGAVTSFASIAYQDRFLDEESNSKIILRTAYPALSNCGVPFSADLQRMLFMDDLYFYYLAFTKRGNYDY
jgi:cbb3-type cytochrome oxidase subunit 3